MPDIRQIFSPNFNERNAAVPLRYVVLHYTGMATAQQAIDRLCQPAAEVSAHYVIEENGIITQLVAEDKRAWHAGKSCWRGISDINSASIGIELVNPGHQHGYRPFSAVQINSLIPLLHAIIARHAFDPKTCILAHSDVAPERKEDPGELFPWNLLAAEGLGLSVEDVAITRDPQSVTDLDVQKLLAAIGYDCPQSGDYDRTTRAALLAFQRRYHPENLTGTPERETLRRLLSIAQQVQERAQI